MTTGPSQVDRLDGVNEGLGRKAPVRAATTANITLSGEQTIDGVACVADDRVLVKDQTDTTENGIYNVSSGNWTRALDANGNRDLVKGSAVLVNEGSTYARTEWVCTSTNPVIIGTSTITWVQLSGGGGGGGGGVSSVGLVMPAAVFNVANSPITGSGDITVTFDNQNQNLVFASPASGGAGQPSFRQLVTADLPSNPTIVGINFVIDGGGSTITTGIKGSLEVPFACTINRVTLLADQSGSIVVDIWKDVYGSYPPTDADSITASAPPTISGANKSQDATLTGWTTSISAGDILRYNVDSVTSHTLVTVALKCTLA